jgi:hypothetical protein
MNTIRVLAAIIFVSLSTGSIAEGETEVDKAKQAAVDTCMKAAEERYGKARTSSKPRKASIGGKRGYKISMRVGNTSKRVACVAFHDGEVTFTADY